MKNADKFWMGIAILAAIGIVAVVIHIFHIEKQYTEDKEQWRRDSLILVSKKFVKDAKLKNDSLMNELVREPWKLDSVSPEVKKEYLRKYKVIE